MKQNETGSIMTFEKILKHCRVAALIVAACAPAVPAAHAEGFYRGKQVKLIIGFGVGGGYDLYARVIARYIGAHIPGNPTIVPSSMPTAGSLTATNYIYNAAPKDGTVFGTVASGAPTVPLLYPDQAKFDAAKITWIGSAAKAIFLDEVRGSVPVKTVEDLRHRETFLGATGPGAAVVDLPLLMNGIAGFRYHLVLGYKTVADIDLAIERGEVEGVSGTTWDTVTSRNAEALKAGKIRIILQYGREKIPELADVPRALDLAKDENDRLAMNLLFARQEMGKPYLAPPDLPVDRTKILRTAFMATMKDPAYAAELKKLKLENSPLTGEEVQAMVDELVKTPPAIVNRVKTILSRFDKSAK
jgi:tripartite-type tricarboxylate transporter receptor subunit TctC